MNRSAARKAAEVAAVRRARLLAHEAAVSEQVAVFFDRSGRAAGVRVETQERAQRILEDGEAAAAALEREADAVVLRLRELRESVSEIAEMTGQSAVGVRAALARAAAATGSVPPPGA